MKIELIQGECLEEMDYISDQSINLILTDPPYGTTACKWDSIISLDQMWKRLKRIIKPNSAIVFTAGQPFTSVLIISNIKMFKYCWTWNKVNSIRNHLNAKKQPMRITEDIVIFYNKQCIYNYIKREGGYTSRKTQPGQSEGFGKVTGIDKGKKVNGLYPINLLNIKGHDPNNVLHPTQKPVALMEYLIKTYTNENETVLDFTMGSGTTGIACKNLNRNFIGIELDQKYFEIAKNRIENHKTIAEELDDL